MKAPRSKVLEGWKRQENISIKTIKKNHVDHQEAKLLQMAMSVKDLAGDASALAAKVSHQFRPVSQQGLLW